MQCEPVALLLLQIHPSNSKRSFSLFFTSTLFICASFPCAVLHDTLFDTLLLLVTRWLQSAASSNGQFYFGEKPHTQKRGDFFPSVLARCVILVRAARRVGGSPAQQHFYTFVCYFFGNVSLARNLYTI